MRANEQWRDDPARREAARKVYESWMRAAQDAQVHIDIASIALLIDLPQASALARALKGVQSILSMASRELTKSEYWISPSEVVIGHLAEVGVGADDTTWGHNVDTD